MLWFCRNSERLNDKEVLKMNNFCYVVVIWIAFIAMCEAGTSIKVKSVFRGLLFFVRRGKVVLLKTN